MLFDKEHQRLYTKKITDLVESLKGNPSWNYITTLSEQLTWFVNQTVSLSRSDDGTNFFVDHRSAIQKAFEVEDFELQDLERAHYLCAKFLRELSYGSLHDYGKSEIVMFYLFPKFEEINYKYADEIRFGVPARKILEPQQNEINKVSAMFHKVEAWEKSLAGWQNRVTSSEERLQGVVNANNYLSLGKAFDNLLTEKRRERNSLRRNLTLVGGFALIIPFLYVMMGTNTFITDFLSENIKATLPTLSTFIFSIVFEALLLYYFRIIYSQWLIAKQHVLQLSLRHEMCAFVNEYAQSAKDMDKNTLAKFENLVFSELSADLNAPPSVYDAVDSIAKVISSMKKPGQ